MEYAMTMQRVQLDISSDIFDKVMFFLEHLPKNKIKLNFDNVFNQSSPKVEPKLIFSDFLNHTQKVNTITKFSRDELHER
jgi:hypothetical protein